MKKTHNFIDAGNFNFSAKRYKWRKLIHRTLFVPLLSLISPISVLLDDHRVPVRMTLNCLAKCIAKNCVNLRLLHLRCETS